MRSGASGLRGVPYGERVPTSPVANWSMFVVPTTIAPAAPRRSTTAADAGAGPGVYAGHAAPVGSPATAMLSLTSVGIPQRSRSPRPSRASRPARSSRDGLVDDADDDRVVVERGAGAA